MKVILDDTTLTDAPNTLAEAIDLAADRATSQGRVVVDVFADGRQVRPDELEDEATLAHSCDEVRLVSAEPRAFVRITLLDARDALDAARSEQQRAAQLVEQGSFEEAYKSLDGSLNLWQAARQALDQGAQLVGLDLTDVPLEHPEELAQAISRLAAALEEVRRSVTAQDWAGLGDVLNYEMDELVDRWQVLLERVADHVHAPAEGH